MGREIRRVPQGWEHPKDARGHYIGLLDMTYKQALVNWREDGAHEDDKPEPEWYRPDFDAEPTHYQIYETVSEGTPVSPVFANLEELQAWLIETGHTPTAAARFAESGWAPSFIMNSRGVSPVGIHSLDW